MKTLMSGGIFHYLQSVQAYISPPIAAVFLFGLFFKWINAKGAIIALWSGFALGMFRLVTEYLSKEGIIMLEQGSAIQIMLDINFLHYAIILFVFSVAVLMIFSKLGTPKRADLLELVTFSKEELNFKITWSTDAVLTVILIACVLTLWIIFSPIGIIS